MSRQYSAHRQARSMGDAIRLFCLECMGSVYDGEVHKREVLAVKECPSEHTCSLWRYRFGKNPAHKRNVSEASLEALIRSRENRSNPDANAKQDR